MIPENILLNSNAYRLSPFPFYSRKFESLTIKKKNYAEVAFKPGLSLQAAELNEIQEHFFLKSSLKLMFYSNWPIYNGNDTDILESLVGESNVPYLFPNMWEPEKSYPLRRKNQITMELTSTINVKFGIGWYHLPLISPDGIIKSNWFYLFEPQTVSLPLTTTDQSLYMSYDISIVESTHLQKDENGMENEGYFFNDRSNEFINPNSEGADRVKLTITGFQPSPFTGSVFICRIVKLSNKYVLRAANNYMMQSIDII